MTSARFRFFWAVGTYLIVQSLIFGFTALPVVFAARVVIPYLPHSVWGRGVVVAIGLLPIYLITALTLMITTAVAIRILGWRTRPGEAMRIADYEWPVLNWGRRGMCTHVVRLFVGTPFRGTPLWGLFIRLNGARVGRGVWVNSTNIIDHELLRFDDGCVIGHDVHLSGHTVEDGLVKTGTVHVGRGATIGVSSVIGIDVDIGDGCIVGALSFVPKHATLEAGAVYAGIPVRRIDHEAQAVIE